MRDNWEILQTKWRKLPESDQELIKECFNGITSPYYYKGFGEFLFEGKKT